MAQVAKYIYCNWQDISFLKMLCYLQFISRGLNFIFIPISIISIRYTMRYFDNFSQIAFQYFFVLALKGIIVHHKNKISHINFCVHSCEQKLWKHNKIFIVFGHFKTALKLLCPQRIWQISKYLLCISCATRVWF